MTTELVPLHKMNSDRAIELCKTRPEQAARLLMALLRQNTAELDDTAFIRRNDVFLKKIRRSIRLAESDGMLLKAGGKYIEDPDGGKKDIWVPNWTLPIAALRKCNETAALQLIRPSTVIVDGKAQMNPFIEVDPENKQPRVVYARCLCVGYSPSGSLVATDAMVRLDAGLYFIEKIQAMMKKNKEQASAFARYGAASSKPKDEGDWSYFGIHGPVGIWFNVAAPQAVDIMEDHISRLKFLERLGQSFAERNAMKAHPAMPKSVHVDRGVARVDMVGWTTDFDRREIDHLRELIEGDRLEEFRDGENRGIEIVATQTTEPDEEDREALDAELDAERKQERALAGEKDEQGEREQADPKLVEAMALAEKVGGDRGKLALKRLKEECGIANLEEATDAELDQFIAGAQEALNKS